MKCTLHYVLHLQCTFSQCDFNEQTEKNCKIFSLYQREFFKKIPVLVTFCTHSVSEGLMSCFKETYCHLLQGDRYSKNLL
jgi:hypothetical protein